jgi:hypothetical protein
MTFRGYVSRPPILDESCNITVNRSIHMKAPYRSVLVLVILGYNDVIKGLVGINEDDYLKSF